MLITGEGRGDGLNMGFYDSIKWKVQIGNVCELKIDFERVNMLKWWRGWNIKLDLEFKLLPVG